MSWTTETPAREQGTLGRRVDDTMAVRPLAVTGLGVVAPTGIGLASLANPPRRGVAPIDAGTDYPQSPARELHTVPEFRLADFVGGKGIRHIDRMTAFCLVAGRLALADAAGVPSSTEKPEPSDDGIVLGTSTGSIRTLAELSYDTLTSALPYLINPSSFPNSVMNSSAGQLAIWSALRGVNATVAGGQVSSLYAMRLARIMMMQGRAGRLVVGGIEELSPQTAWAWEHSGALAPGTALGEGCALFVVDPGIDPAHPSVHAQLLAAETQYCGDGEAVDPRRLRHGLTSAIARALSRSRVHPRELVAVSLGATGLRGLERLEERSVELAIQRPMSTLASIKVARTLGVTYSASGAFQLAALLARWRAGELPPGPALITSVGPDSHAGCVVVRGPSSRSAR